MADSSPRYQTHNAKNPHPVFDAEEYHANFGGWRDGFDDVFDVTLQNTLWDGISNLSVNPYAPAEYNQLVFEVTNFELYEKNKDRLPLATWLLGTPHQRFLGYVLERAARPKPMGEKGCPVNLINQIQADMSHERDGYGITTATAVSAPDPELHVCQWSGRDWSLARLKLWQNSHRFGRHMWTPDAQSLGGSANSEAQQAVRATNARIRALNTRVSDLRAYAMYTLGWNEEEIKEELGIVHILQKMKRVCQIVPNLSEEEVVEALTYAKSRDMDITPWTESQVNYDSRPLK